jgi:hypothetical protein
LGCAVEVAHTFTGGDQVAACPGDAVEQARLAGERDRRRFIEAPHAFLELAVADEGAPLEPESKHLELRGVEGAAEFDRARRELPRFGRVLVQCHRDVAFVDRQPAVIDSRFEPVDEAVGALEPAVGNCRLAAEEKMVGGEIRGDPRRRTLVTTLQVQTVGALSRVERKLRRVQHVADPAHAFERLWGLAFAQGLLEGGLRAGPIPFLERIPARVERGETDRVLLRHDAAEYESGRTRLRLSRCRCDCSQVRRVRS